MEYFPHLQDSFLEENSTANSSCPSSPVKWCTGNYNGGKLCIQNPTLIPTCVLALLIGIFCSKRLSRFPGKFPSRRFYELAFFLYGIMMTSAGILYCIFGGPQQLSNTLENTGDDSIQLVRLLAGVIDTGLTSNIAFTFLFCGLCDIKFFNPKSIWARYLLYILYFVDFLLWTLGLINGWKWVFYVLYMGNISISCCIYLFTQLCIKSNRRALPALFVAGLYGAIGLIATSFGAEHVCESEGPFWSQYIGPQFIWYLFSDISMAFIYIYVIRVNQEKKLIMKKYDFDIEKHPEKL